MATSRTCDSPSGAGFPILAFRHLRPTNIAIFGSGAGVELELELRHRIIADIQSCKQKRNGSVLLTKALSFLDNETKLLVSLSQNRRQLMCVDKLEQMWLSSLVAVQVDTSHRKVLESQRWCTVPGSQQACTLHVHARGDVTKHDGIFGHGD